MTQICKSKFRNFEIKNPHLSFYSVKNGHLYLCLICSLNETSLPRLSLCECFDLCATGCCKKIRRYHKLVGNVTTVMNDDL